MKFLRKISSIASAIVLLLCSCVSAATASEIDLNIPSLDVGYDFGGWSVTGSQILLYGLAICALGMIFGLFEFLKIKKCRCINLWQTWQD